MEQSNASQWQCGQRRREKSDASTIRQSVAQISAEMCIHIVTHYS